MDLKVHQLNKTYDDMVILEDLTLEISDHHIVSIIGPSGGGKSTFLRLIAGLESFDSGHLKVNNHDLASDDLNDYRKQVGFVFQTHHLFPHLKVIDNVTLPLKLVHGKSNEEAKTIAMDLLEQFGLGEHYNKYPHQISGGQAQRVSIVRSLAINPEMILFDEPTSSLDPVLTNEVLNAISELKKKQKDLILVTHEIGFAKAVSDYILFIHDGKIIEHGDVSILDSPKTTELSLFLDKVLKW